MINLLPPEQKKELEKEKQFKLSLVLGIIFLAFLLFLFLTLFLINIYISSESDVQKIILNIQEKEFEASGMKNFQQKNLILNEKISKLESFYKNQINLTDILNKVIGVLPSRVYLTSFSWEKESNRINILGFTPFREDLFELQKRLKENFIDVNFPQANWVKPKDVDFFATFSIK